MAFNINAHVILQGPKNISAVTKSIRSQLQNINVNVGLNIPNNVQSQLTNLNNQLNNANKNSQKFANTAKTTSTSVKNMANSTKGAANAMQVLGKETALTFKRFAAAGIVTATFFRLTQAISEAVPKALEFERGLVKLQQITGSTAKGLGNLKNSVSSLSQQFGKDANELLELAQIFAQTGQSIRQVEASVRAVARSSLAPTFGDMKQTAEGLVAALNQFGIAASDSEKVLGSLNRVSKKFADESDDLIAAIFYTTGTTGPKSQMFVSGAARLGLDDLDVASGSTPVIFDLPSSAAQIEGKNAFVNSDTFCDLAASNKSCAFDIWTASPLALANFNCASAILSALPNLLFVSITPLPIE